MSPSQRPMSGPLASRLTGVWTLVGYSHQQAGREDTYPLGAQPEGFLIYTPEGFVSAQLMKPGRSRFQSTDWHEGTPEEYKEAGSGYIAYCGIFEVDEENETVTHIPSVALLPNLIHGRQLRLVTLTDENLTLRAAGSSEANVVTSVLHWKKAGSASNRGN
jgi:hypothetical protein